MNGFIKSFDAADGLGWIEIDDGRQVRFGLSACKGLTPAVGARVRVGGLQDVLGKLKATSVEPVFDHFDVEERVWPKVLQEFLTERRWVDGTQRDIRVHRTLFDRDGLHKLSPHWPAPSLFADAAVMPAQSEAWEKAPLSPPHPFFEPWHQGICGTAIGALNFSPADDSSVASSQIGGTSARLVRPWPECSSGHGPMTLLVIVDAADLAPLSGSLMRLTIHACPPCLRENHHAWLDTSGVASVEWSRDADGEIRSGEAEAALPVTRLRPTPVRSFPHSWLFSPRRDVEGHLPVEGVAGAVLQAKVLRDEVRDPAKAYDDASFVYDRHYATPTDLLLGGFSTFRFALCRTCKRPLRQLLYLSDYMTDNAFADLFDGSNELTLLTCDRTTACGGPERGLLVLDP